jgi:hypothetical protein
LVSQPLLRLEKEVSDKLDPILDADVGGLEAPSINTSGANPGPKIGLDEGILQGKLKGLERPVPQGRVNLLKGAELVIHAIIQVWGSSNAIETDKTLIPVIKSFEVPYAMLAYHGLLLKAGLMGKKRYS